MESAPIYRSLRSTDKLGPRVQPDNAPCACDAFALAIRHDKDHLDILMRLDLAHLLLDNYVLG